MSRDLLRFLTCGGVDDGKSTLIGRLLHDTRRIHEDQLAALARDSARYGTTGGLDLALLTDGLRAEREQGITIDVAHRHFATDRRAFIIADTPGHEQYTRNMVTGASTCRLAVILVDARRGVLTQTRRHSFIVALLGIEHVVVAVNKMDLVGYARDRFEAIRADYAAFVAKLGIPDVRFIPMSALHGENVVTASGAMPWYHGPTLLGHLETVPVAGGGRLADLRFPVQYVIRAPGDFRGLAGTVAAGTVRAGDEVMVLPGERTTRVRSIVTCEGERAEAGPGQAVTLTLDDALDVSRGDMLVHPGRRPRLAARVEAMLVWMAERPLVAGQGYWIKHATRTVAATVDELRHAVDVNTLETHAARHLEMNAVGQVVLELGQPIAHDPYASCPATGAFIVIDRISNDTVGAGMLLEPVSSGGALLEPGRVGRAEREARLGQRGVTILLEGGTGDEAASVAHALDRALFDRGRTALVVRADEPHGEAGPPGAAEALARAAGVARLLNDAGLVCVLVAGGEAGTVVARVVGADRVLVARVGAPAVGGPAAGAGVEIAGGTGSAVERAERIAGELIRRRLLDVPAPPPGPA